RMDPGPARGRPGPGSREAIDITLIRAGNIRPLLGLYLGGEIRSGPRLGNSRSSFQAGPPGQPCIQTPRVRGTVVRISPGGAEMAGVRYPIEMVQGVPSVQVNGVGDTGIVPVTSS